MNLKPCPFCGSKTAPTVKTLAELDGIGRTNLAYKYSASLFTVVCDNNEGGCGAGTNRVSATGNGAIEDWNRRAEL